MRQIHGICARPPGLVVRCSFSLPPFTPMLASFFVSPFPPVFLLFRNHILISILYTGDDAIVPRLGLHPCGSLFRKDFQTHSQNSCPFRHVRGKSRPYPSRPQHHLGQIHRRLRHQPAYTLSTNNRITNVCCDRHTARHCICRPTSEPVCE